MRKKDGRSAPWVAGKLNVSRDAVYKWESGDLNPTPANIFGLAEIFGDEVIERFRAEHMDFATMSPPGRRSGMSSAHDSS